MIGAMFGQAFSSEWVKALRQPRALFWAFLFTPLAGFVIEIAKLLIIKAKFPQMAAMASPAPMKALLEACGTAHNPLVLLFLILGAANIFAGEYRWNTWRYLLVRNGRLQVMAAKLAVFALLAAGVIVLFMLGSLLATVVDSAINHVALKPGADGSLLAVIMAFGLVLLNLAGVGALVALASVFTRSLTGAIISIIVFLLVVAFSEQLVTQFRVLWAQPLLPGLALGRLMLPVMEMAGQIPRGAALPDTNVAADLAVLGAWLGVPAALTAVLFARQDLSRE